MDDNLEQATENLELKKYFESFSDITNENQCIEQLKSFSSKINFTPQELEIINMCIDILQSPENTQFSFGPNEILSCASICMKYPEISVELSLCMKFLVDIMNFEWEEKDE